MGDQPVSGERGARELREKLAQVTIALLMLLTLAMYIVAAVLAAQTASRPFLGALVEPTLVVNVVGEDDWSGRAAGLNLPDHIVALDGQPLTRPWSLYDALSAYETGDTVNLTVERPEGDVRSVTVELQSFPASALVSFFVFPYGIGLAFLLIGSLFCPHLWDDFRSLHDSPLDPDVGGWPGRARREFDRFGAGLPQTF
jgi:hypothetical protein